MSTIKENIKIDGYDQMTPEQKVAALEAMQLPQPDLSGYISKDTFDKKVSELAASNRRVKELEGTKLTEEEAACIVYHMGAYTEKEKWDFYGRAIERFPNVLWTHHADMIASKIKGV